MFFQISNGFSQSLLKWESSVVCNQIDVSLKYVQQDKEEKIKNIRLQNSISDSRNYDALLVEYVSFKIQVDPTEVFNQPADIISPLFKKIENASNKCFKLDIFCLSKEFSKPNAFVSKIDDETIVIKFVKKNLGANEGESGVTYLFCFKNEKLFKVYKSHWMS
jgi:lysyl-tRNA synthetase class II